MASLSEILNGRPGRPLDNTIRSVMAAAFMIGSGFVNVGVNAVLHPEYGVGMNLFMMLMPMAIGFAEVLRQVYLNDKNNASMDFRFFTNNWRYRKELRNRNSRGR